MQANHFSLSYINRKYSVLFINAYFILSALKGLTLFLGNETPFTIITDIGIILITIEYLIWKNSNAIIKFILISIVTFAFTSLFNTYPLSALISCIRWQLLYMLAFIVGTSNFFYNWKFFNTMIYVVFIVDLIGLILYFISPGWYIDYKLRNLDFEYISDNIMLEMSRLSSFWPYPYWVSYGSACSYFYILCQYYYGNIKRPKAIFFLLFFFFIILLAQQRLPLFFIIFATFFLFIYSFISNNRRKRDFQRLFIGLSLMLILLIFFVLPTILDISIIEFGLNKIQTMFEDTNNNGQTNFLTSRFNFIDRINYQGISFFGEGLGAFSFNSDAKFKLLDNMWLTIFVESGLYGLFVYITIFIISFKKGLRNLKYNLFELGILIMFIIGMFGANCLSKNTQHAIVLWICCGRIFNQYCLQYKKQNIKI